MDNILVVARYKENLEWINHLDTKYIVYNKGNNDLDYLNPININIIPNIGYEAYVYLKYIVDNYNNLPDQIIFTQGNPFDHSPQFLDLVNLYHDDFSDIQPLTLHYKSDPKYDVLKNQKPDICFGDMPVHIEYYDNEYQYIQNIPYINNGTKYVFKYLRNFFNHNDIVKGIMDFVNIKPRFVVIPFCFAAIFSVSKHKILSYPKDFYVNLLIKCLYLNKKTKNSDKIFAWIMEYSWMEIFGYHNKNIHYPKPSDNHLDTVFFQKF